MAIQDNDFEVTITLSVRRSEQIATGRSVMDNRQYIFTDFMSESEVNALISELTPVVDSTI